MVYDVVVIGAGPAAWSAATYLVRAGISVLVVGEDEKSGLADASEVWNYPGFADAVPGRVLLDAMIEQAKKQGVEFLHAEITHVEANSEEQMVSSQHSVENRTFLIRTADRKEFYAKNLVLAHGAFYMKANIPGEKEYVGRGVHYCTLCDGPLYKGKDVMVIGNGNFAAEEALQLSAYAKHVFIVSHATNVAFSSEYIEALNVKKIECRAGRVKEIQGDSTHVTGISLDGKIISVRGVFIAIGMAASPAFAQKLGLELNGEFVRVDEHMHTSREGVWAIGMARGGVNQIAKSVGDGAVAAVDIIKKLKGLPSYMDHT